MMLFLRSVKLLLGYLSLQVLAFSISFCCLHHLDLLSLCLLHSSNPAAIKHISAAILQHTKPNWQQPCNNHTHISSNTATY